MNLTFEPVELNLMTDAEAEHLQSLQCVLDARGYIVLHDRKQPPLGHIADFVRLRGNRVHGLKLVCIGPTDHKDFTQQRVTMGLEPRPAEDFAGRVFTRYMAE